MQKVDRKSTNKIMKNNNNKITWCIMDVIYKEENHK